MANERDEILRLVDQSQADLLRQENSLVRDIHQGYENARKELLGRFTDAWHGLGDEPTPQQVRQLATDINLIQAIEQRLAQLQSEFAELLGQGLGSVRDAGFEAAANEVGILAQGLGISLFPFALDANLELTIAPALEQVPGLTDTLKTRITATLREMLASGDRFKTIVDAVFGKNQGIWPNGKTSAELMIRRAVIQANNNARLLYYGGVKGQIPGLKKQAVASLQGDTTDACLRVHGQIQELDEPFVIEGTPSFGRRQMQPPFHWNCRSSVVGYHPIFEQSSTLTTQDMVAAAQKELAKR